MKRYILKKDLPFIEAGEHLEIYHSDDKKWLHIFDNNGEELYQLKVGDNVAKMHNEWFEEIQEYFYIDSRGTIEYSRNEWNEDVVEDRKLIGNYFETKEEAEKYLKYLKARVIIKEDAKGFTPDWDDEDEPKYMGRYSCISGKTVFDWYQTYHNAYGTIFFKTTVDIKKSFENHPDEWKTYLTYEQQN